MPNRLGGIQLLDLGDIGLGVPGIQNRQIISFDDLTNFNRDIQKFQAKTNAKLDNVMGKICKDLFDKIVLKTPVDSGQTRASWRMGINQVDTSTEPEGRIGKQAATTKATAQAAAISRVIEAGDTIFISNNLPWAITLEFGRYPKPGGDKTRDGYSIQAVGGMVRASIQQFDFLVVEAVTETTYR